MNEPDFSGIDPLRVPEARRRVAVLNRYLSIANPTRKDSEAHAAELGLSKNGFSRLARVWRDHRDARLLVIGKRGASKRDYGVSPRAIEITVEEIARAGGRAALKDIAPIVERRCAEEGIAPPARGTINNYIRDARARAGAEIDGPPRIVVGRMWFHLPIAGLPQSAMPTLLAAVLVPERIVVAHEISTDPASPPSVDQLIRNLAHSTTWGAEPRPLLLEPDDRRVGSIALETFGLEKTKSHNRSVQRELSKAFAGRLGSLDVIHQRGMAKPATKRVITRQDEALPPEEVATIIERAIASSNAAAVTGKPRFTLKAI